MAQFGDVLAGDVLAFEEVEDEPAPAASESTTSPARSSSCCSDDATNAW